MDKSDFIQQPATDPGTAFLSVARCGQHAATVRRPGYGSIVAEMARHLDQEPDLGLPKP